MQIPIRDLHPELDPELWEMLARFEAVLRVAGAPVVDNLAPGIAPEAVRGMLAQIGMEPGRELLTWWAWHNGLANPASTVGGAVRLVTWLPYSVDQAMADWQWRDKGDQPWEWAPTWLPIGSPGSMPRLAADCTPPQGRACTVKAVSPDAGMFADQRETRTLSEAVQMWLEAVENGWFVVVPPTATSKGGWDFPLDFRPIPTLFEYGKTGLI